MQQTQIIGLGGVGCSLGLALTDKTNGPGMVNRRAQAVAHNCAGAIQPRRTDWSPNYYGIRYMKAAAMTPRPL